MSADKINPTIRIRMPEGYETPNEFKLPGAKIGDNPKPLTIEEFAAIMKPTFARLVQYHATEDMLRFEDMVFFGSKQWGVPYKPPTRWQKFERRIEDLKQRARDIWTILKGGDIHENCDCY